MKSFKILAMGIMALAAASLASAATNIKITGSTAFRKAATQAIIHCLKTSSPAPTYAADGTDISGASRVTIVGKLLSDSSDVVIQCAWGGSVGGVAVLDGGLTTIPGVSFDNAHSWIKATKATQTVTLGGTVAAPTFTAITALTTLELADSANFDAAATADIAMSDSYQASTDYTVNGLGDDIVGAVTFAWTKGANYNSGDSAFTAAYGRLANITTQQAQALLNNGDVPLSMLTGVAADSAYLVVLTGRNNDSGTRLTAFAESGFGIGTAPVQYSVNTTTGALTAFAPTDGYASSSTVKTVLQALPTASTSKLRSKNYILLSYVGSGTITSQQLTYNGATFSNTAVQEGQYNFWGYEHLLRSTTIAGVADTFATNLVTQLTGSDDATANGVRYSTMRVSRTIDGGLINTNL